MAKKNAKQSRKEAKGESVQTFLPVQDIRNGPKGVIMPDESVTELFL